ncbi:MAG: hypothetical protein OXF98_10770 [Rhodospirillaceae bacterium]|nr:hypothetical protein [Rhodospirillaceae bacterium]
MAAEAGISPAALRAAIEQVPQDPAAAAPRTAAGAAGLAVLGVLLAFPAAAQVLLWLTVLVLVLAALGALPV